MRPCSAAQPVWQRDRKWSRVTGEQAGCSRKKAVSQENKMLFFSAVIRKAQKRGTTLLFFSVTSAQVHILFKLLCVHTHILLIFDVYSLFMTAIDYLKLMQKIMKAYCCNRIDTLFIIFCISLVANNHDAIE